MAHRIFLSYRREDSKYIAAALHDVLEKELGEGRVFFDVDSIPPGVDFRNHIAEVLINCDILVAVIGPKWIGRLVNEGDFVRLEIERALDLGIQIIPIFVQGIQGIPNKELPASLESLSYLEGLHLRSGRDWRIDLAYITSQVINLLKKIEAKRQPEAEAQSKIDRHTKSEQIRSTDPDLDISMKEAFILITLAISIAIFFVLFSFAGKFIF